VINHKKKERKARERVHQSEEVAAELRKSLFVPQENFGIKDKGINIPLSTVHSVWVTAERLKREERSLGCHPCDYFSLTSGTYLTVPHEQLQQPEPSLFTKFDQVRIRIKY
jgi:hypothetical protein